MINKSKDSNTTALGELLKLQGIPYLTPARKKMVSLEIDAIRAGLRGETPDTNCIDFELNKSKNPVVVHDLKIECNGGKALNVSGPQIRRIRNAHCWSQPELATRCRLAGWDVSRDIIARIECRTRWVGDFELAILAAALKVEIAKLLPRRGNVKTEPKNLAPGRIL